MQGGKDLLKFQIQPHLNQPDKIKSSMNVLQFNEQESNGIKEQEDFNVNDIKKLLEDALQNVVKTNNSALSNLKNEIKNLREKVFEHIGSQQSHRMSSKSSRYDPENSARNSGRVSLSKVSSNLDSVNGIGQFSYVSLDKQEDPCARIIQSGLKK